MTELETAARENLYNEALNAALAIFPDDPIERIATDAKTLERCINDDAGWEDISATALCDMLRASSTSSTPAAGFDWAPESAFARP